MNSEPGKPRHAHTTLPQALGELELNLMERLWDNPGADAKRLTEDLAFSRKVTLSTVQSTLERLVRKGHLLRRKQGLAYRYFPCNDRAEYLGSLLRDVIGLLHDGTAATILSSFVNVAARLEDGALDELEELVRRKRRQLEQGHE
jgi:predicted transcriptional regulator